MSSNKYNFHIRFIPEDSACRQIINGFVDSLPIPKQRLVQAVRETGGYGKTFDVIAEEELQRYPERRLIIVVDSDDKVERRKALFDEKINKLPVNCRLRVYILSSLKEAENLKKTFKATFEDIGGEIKRGCEAKDFSIWTTPLLAHNKAEVQRLMEDVRPYLF